MISDDGSENKSEKSLQLSQPAAARVAEGHKEVEQKVAKETGANISSSLFPWLPFVQNLFWVS
jgi:hypothetical protein